MTIFARNLYLNPIDFQSMSVKKETVKKLYMTHSYRLHYFHLFCLTRERLPHIAPDVQSHLLYPYLEAIIRNHSGKLLEIGGISDYVHLLIDLSVECCVNLMRNWNNLANGDKAFKIKSLS